jgi:CRISPR/Cas system CSM-associated protein Csm3 (group 7 of RAMP superfamily)
MAEPIKSQDVKLYKVRVETLQPFRIGANVDPMSDIEGPITMLGGEIVIQGSSLKGALRAQIEEYLVLNFPKDSAMQSCIPAADNNLSPDERRLIDEGKFKRGGNCGYDYKNRDKMFLCPPCYLLGTMGLVGFVQVPYLYVTNDINVEEMYANRRDRGSNRVADRANRSMQLLPKGTVFEGTLEVILEDRLRGWKLGTPRNLQAGVTKENPNPVYFDEWLKKSGWDQARVLKELIVNRLTSIKRLGGQASKGFGNVEVTVTDVGQKAV